MFAPYPFHDLAPGVGAQVLERGAGHAGPKEGAPAPQQPVERDEQGVERQVGSCAPALFPHLAREGLDGLAGWIGIDVVPVGAWLAVALHAPAEEVQALVDVGDQRLVLRQAQAHGGQDLGDLVTECLRIGSGAGNHQAPVVGEADEPEVRQSAPSASLPCAGGGPWPIGCLGEVVVQHRQGHVAEQR